ncbi:hypothetical protein pah_c180o019 [Parachlamydia acanthamoebae str. Hall's coccus]|nr:hypothetical protein pah_c180o019 [Parachlamydia acanthamoebae str. Hall's coccus]
MPAPFVNLNFLNTNFTRLCEKVNKNKNLKQETNFLTLTFKSINRKTILVEAFIFPVL